MGLYESEINKQLHLRNRQRREWESMKKKQIADDENKKRQSSHQQKLLEQERREQDQIEMNETNVSKKLTASMVNACQEAEDDDDVLIKVVEVLRDQNGNFFLIFFIKHSKEFQTYLHISLGTKIKVVWTTIDR